MASRHIYLTGDAALNAKLKALTSPVAKRVIKESAKPALKPVLRQSQDLAPVRKEGERSGGEVRPPGGLRKSLRIKALRRSRTRYGYRVTTAVDFFKGHQFYGAFQEFGWKSGAAFKTLATPETQSRVVIRRTGKSYTRTQIIKRTKADGRKQIEGRRFLKRAAKATQSEALAIYRRLLSESLIRLARGNTG